MDSLDNFYFEKTEPKKSCLLFLRELILNQDDLVAETKKYGMPCFCYNGKMFCYLWVEKKTDFPYLLFVEGNKLEHPKLERGSRARMKILSINPNEDIDVESIQQLLNKALDLYRGGVIIIK